MVYEYRSTRDTGDRGGGAPRKPFPVTRRDRGGGCSTPLPVSPSPTGAIPHRYRALQSVNQSVGEKSPKILFPLPWHGHRVNHPSLPTPLEGAGGGRASGRVVGVSSDKKTSGAMEETGGKEILPSPYPRRNRSPSPPIPQDTLPAPGSSGGKSRYTAR